MTAMPQLVAAFHSLVGLAACMVAVAAIHAPAAYRIAEGGGIRLESLIELSVGLAIGAVTFTGSLIAFAKLNGNMSGAPIKLPGAAPAQHRHRRRDRRADRRSGDERRPRALGLLGDLRPGADRRGHPDHPDRRRRHAGRDLDAEQLLRLGGGGAGLHARQHHPDHHRRPGRLVGGDPQLHHVQGDEPLVRLGDPRRLRRRDRKGRPARSRRGR